MPSTGDLRERLIRIRDTLGSVNPDMLTLRQEDALERDRDTLEEAVNVLAAYELGEKDLKPFPVWNRKDGTRATAYIPDEPKGSA